MEREFSNYSLALSKLKKNDLRAFEYLYENMRPLLYGIAYDIVQDDAASKDLVQDFFIDFWNLKLYNQVNVSLKNYLIKSVAHRAFNFLDKRNTEKRLKSSYIYISEVSPTYKLEQHQTSSLINNALKKVPPGASEVFTLHYIDELSHLQIAEKLGLSAYTVRNQISKALKILRVELKKLKIE